MCCSSKTPFASNVVQDWDMCQGKVSKHCLHLDPSIIATPITRYTINIVQISNMEYATG